MESLSEREKFLSLGFLSEILYISLCVSARFSAIKKKSTKEMRNIVLKIIAIGLCII